LPLHHNYLDACIILFTKDYIYNYINISCNGVPSRFTDNPKLTKPSTHSNLIHLTEFKKKQSFITLATTTTRRGIERKKNQGFKLERPPKAELSHAYIPIYIYIS